MKNEAKTVEYLTDTLQEMQTISANYPEKRLDAENKSESLEEAIQAVETLSAVRALWQCGIIRAEGPVLQRRITEILGLSS